MMSLNLSPSMLLRTSSLTLWFLWSLLGVLRWNGEAERPSVLPTRLPRLTFFLKKLLVVVVCGWVYGDFEHSNCSTKITDYEQNCGRTANRSLKSRPSCDTLLNNCDSCDLLFVRGSNDQSIFLPRGGVVGNFF